MRIKADIDAADVRIEAAPPSHISQRTSETSIGVHRRAFLESLPRFEAAGGTVLRLGRLRIVERVAYLRWLAEQSEPREERDDDGVAALASELGLRAVGGG